jgi:hypothetical protein
MAASLSVHKNKIEARKRRELQRDMSRSVHEINQARHVKAYAIVTFNDDGSACCDWDTGGIMPMWGFGEAVSEVLRTDLAQRAHHEDYRPKINNDWKRSK